MHNQNAIDKLNDYRTLFGKWMQLTSETQVKGQHCDTEQQPERSEVRLKVFMRPIFQIIILTS